MILLFSTTAVAIAAALIHIGSLSVHLMILSATLKALILFVIVAALATAALWVRLHAKKGRAAVA